MNRKRFLTIYVLLAALLMSGCTFRTLEQMYALPKRSEEYLNLQQVIDEAMTGLEYSAPLSGDNQQTVQKADLNGDGEDEYLTFAKDASEQPLKILIFSRTGDEYSLLETIEMKGAAFDRVEYVNTDGRAGVELAVGRQIGNQVPGALSVYSFFHGDSQQLMTVSYGKFVTCDLNRDGRTEVMVISHGPSETDSAVAALYVQRGGGMARSSETPLSAPVSQIKRIMVGRLAESVPAVYVASSQDDEALITDIFAIRDGSFTNISLSNGSGISVQTLRNYYVYAVDIDNDGILELPDLITMTSPNPSIQQGSGKGTQYLIRWYAMGLDGAEHTRMYSFHNYDGGWYVRLSSDWAERISVAREGGSYIFYLWDEELGTFEKLFTVFTFNGANRDQDAAQSGRFVLYKADGVVYAAQLEAAAALYEITQETLCNDFRLIQLEWKTGET